MKGEVSIIKKREANVFFKQRAGIKLKVTKMMTDELEEKTRMDALVAEMGVKIKDLKEGEGFGEKALIENSKRTASILTNTNCEFILVFKDDYLSVVNKFDNRRQAKIQFVKTKIPFMDSINSMEIWDQLFYEVKDQDYPRETVIVTEDKPGNYIFFLASGQCIVEKTFIIKRKKAQTEETREFKRTIATLEVGSCFGEEILENNSNYRYTVKVRKLEHRTNKKICFIYELYSYNL